MRHRIIFMGTPAYAVPYLEGLIEAGMKPVAVISQPDRPVGRKQLIEPTPVKACAQKHGIPVLQQENLRTQHSAEKIRELKADLIVVVAFGQIIPKSILALPPKGCINVHPSLLPRHRGPSPLQETILKGDARSGVTIMLIDEKVDHGDILRQESFSVHATETFESLRKKTTTHGVPLLVKTINDWIDGTITPQAQDDTQATYTRLLTRDSGKIDWKLSCEEIERSVRALNPWPGTWTHCGGKRVKILQAQSCTTPIANHAPGTIFQSSEMPRQLMIACGRGSLSIERLQMEGKRGLSAHEFLAGYKEQLGSICD
ncbi:methionyl-tRNA formyltransferase [Candidatus Uhrbacteria bacterium]|nr:methionyl-tRNA formyltransferase [Candidatus Uhrbacteria bacterium]